LYHWEKVLVRQKENAPSRWSANIINFDTPTCFSPVLRYTELFLLSFLTKGKLFYIIFLELLKEVAGWKRCFSPVGSHHQLPDTELSIRKREEQKLLL